MAGSVSRGDMSDFMGYVGVAALINTMLKHGVIDERIKCNLRTLPRVTNFQSNH